MYEDIQDLKLDWKGKILTITIDNPPMNSVTQRAHTELSRIFHDVNRDPDTAVVVLTGAGSKAFCAGGDIKNMARRAEERRIDEHVPGMIEAKDILMGLLRMERPLIGRINGHAMGLGSSLAAFCDISFMVEHAKIADTHVKVGIVAGDGGAAMWPLLMGFQRAKRYLLTGDVLTGREAAAMGLIFEAVKPEELDEKVYGLAEQLASGATVAINATKKAVNLLLIGQLESIIERQLAMELHSFYTEDHLEAARAFRDNRTALFKGK